jgi:hypothetical protein
MLLLGLFGFALIAPAVPAGDPESELPSCCRRDGKHACGMMERKTPAGPAWQTARCPSFPAVKGLPAARADADAPQTTTWTFSASVSEAAARLQTAPALPVVHDRSCQKRGPPTLA